MIIYRSSWELDAMIFFDNNDSIIEWGSEETVVWYLSPIDGKRHRYFVDFVIKVLTKEGIKTIAIEIKPYSRTIPPVLKNKKPSKSYMNEVLEYGRNTAKWDAARQFCAKRGWDFQIITEKELFGARKK